MQFIHFLESLIQLILYSVTIIIVSFLIFITVPFVIISMTIDRWRTNKYFNEIIKEKLK